MGYVLGAGIVFYAIYAIFALIFKHIAGWIIASILSFLIGIGTAIGSGSFGMIISMIVVAIIVWFVSPLHIRDKYADAEDEKEEVTLDDFDDDYKG